MKMSPMLSAILNNANASTATTTTPATVTTSAPVVIETTATTVTTSPATTEPAPVELTYDYGAGLFKSFGEAFSINGQVHQANNEIRRDRNQSLKVSKLMYEKEVSEAKYNRKIRDIEIRDNAATRIAENRKRGKEAKSELTGLARWF